MTKFGLMAAVLSWAAATQVGAQPAPQPAVAPLPSRPPTRMITSPDWARLPNGGNLSNAYPRKAIKDGVSGRSKLQCKVREDGGLSDCVVLEECPLGYGFGAAALKIVSYFRMRPTTVDGVPVAGGTVNIPISWRLPGGKPAPATCEAPAKMDTP